MITFNHNAKADSALPICFFTACTSHRQEPICRAKDCGIFHQILFVVNGSGTVRCGGHSWELKKGSAFFVSKSMPVEYSGTENLVTAFLTANGSAIDALMRFYSCDGFLFRERIDLEKYLSGIEDIIRSYYENKQSGRLSALVYSLYTDFFQPQKTPVTHLDQVVMYIEQHYSEKLTLAQLAEVGCMSVSKLSHDFKDRFQVSVFAYILNLRLSFAQTLLITSPNMSTKEVAASCGFEDISYFCRAYRSKFGKSTSEEKTGFSHIHTKT